MAIDLAAIHQMMLTGKLSKENAALLMKAERERLKRADKK